MTLELLQYQVHPNTKFGDNVRLGFGVVIEEGCEIGDNTLIGHYSVLRENTKIGSNCKIGHYFVSEGNNSIGNNVRIGPHCIITYKAIVEDGVFIAPHYVGLNDKTVGKGKKEELVGPTLKKNSSIGSGAVICAGIVIGEEAVVGAQSFVTKDVPDKWIVYGIPAKIRRTIDD